jgi:hypothetical protein
MKKLIKVLPALAAILLGTTMAFAQSTNSYLLPYGMSAGMSVLNRAMQPRPASVPTPVVPEAAGYGAQAGDRRLVCEQWNGQRWVVIPVKARQCQP